jgi:CheY-like chemotaxis protein
MKKRLSGFPIKRKQLFTLANGKYVVQWNELTVRTLFEDKALAYRADQDYGAPVSDFELKQLKLAQFISHFNHQYIWLSPPKTLVDAKRVTRISKRVQLSETDEAPAVVHRPQASRPSSQDEFSDSMDTGQMIRTMMSDRQVLLVLQNPTEQDLLKQLLTEMQFDVVITSNAQQGLLYLEDHQINLLITDLYLPDMHAWQMIAKIQEISPYANIPVLVITDEVMPTMRAFAGEHISRPVSISRLRYYLWKALQERSQFGKSMLKTTALAEN